MDDRKRKIGLADEALLAELGYKQEFRREFTPLEVRRFVHLTPRLIFSLHSSYSE